MLPKAQLTLHSRMSGFMWVTTHHRGYLSHEDLFLYSSSVYSCHLFLISSASVRSIPFLPFIVLIFAWNVSLVALIFLKRSLVFPILLFSSIPLHWSLRKATFRCLYLSFSPLPFLNPAWTSEVHVLLKSGLENFEHYFASVWDECNCAVVWTLFSIALWDWNENWPFPSLWPPLNFPNLLT